MDIEKIEYLLQFLTDREKDLLERMYHDDYVGKEDRVIQQIEQTLKKRNQKDLEQLEKDKQTKGQIENLETKIKLDKKDLDKLNALEVGGVDNWEWYGEALTEWFEKYQTLTTPKEE